MPMRISLIAMLTFFWCGFASAEQVLACHDGDTCHVQTQQGVFKVRLSGIDAPEIKQDGGRQAQQYLSNLVVGKEINLKCMGTSGDRETCRMFLADLDVQAEMVRAGWAWDYYRFSKGEYLALQRAAKQARLGLWADPNPMNPECWRFRNSPLCRNHGD